MLVFSENAWHVIVAAVVFFAGMALAVSQKRVFCVPHKRALALYFWHSFFCIVYFWYSLSNSADATNYFLSSLTYDMGFKFGTAGINYFASFFTQGLGFSYGNMFLVFNIFGYLGLLAFGSTLQHVTRNSRRDIQRFSILILFLPGLSFWSSALGKDALTFMGAGLITWAVLDLGRRIPAVIVGALCFLVPRPHMAGVLLLSLCFALLVSSRLGFYKKLALLAVTMPLTIVGVQFGLSYAGLEDPTNLNEIGQYFETRQSKNLDGGSSVDIASMPLALRMIAYLFRPFFFDAGGILGLVVSFENLALVSLIAAVVLRKNQRRSTLGKFEFAFYSIFVCISWFILANSSANLGIAIRQKIMFLPMLIVLIFSIWHGRGRRIDKTL